ncbi:MAG: response regulator, partial [Planctomycetota bacterium]
ILDFSKIEAGSFQLHAEPFDLPGAIEASTELFAQRTAQKNVGLGAYVDPAIPSQVRGDKDRLRQVLINLLGNAVKFTERGAVLVRVELAERDETSCLVRFSVTDSGLGISEENIRLLFQPFSQVDLTATRKHGGTGLGLAISKRLTEMMGGQIGVTSESGKGSTFWFTARLEVCATATSTARQDLRGLSVLIADDNKAHEQLLEEQLTSWGFHVARPPSGTGVLDLVRGSPKLFDVAILDSHLEGVDVLHLARAIKDEPRGREMVVIVTKPMDAWIEKEAMRVAGVAQCVSKPVRSSRLFDAIGDSLNTQRLGAQSPGPGTPLEARPSRQLADIAKRKGAMILLAEDNPINQELATEILRQAGYDCQTVVTGIEAVDAAMTAKFDLVLMDCQMPEMDGLTATGLIREKENLGMVLCRGGGRLPIVALTANALQGEPQRCRAAGMDDYMSKPIDPDLLVAKIEALLPEAPGEGAEAGSSAAAAPARADKPEIPAAIDLATLLTRCVNNRELAAKVLDMFRQQAPKDMDALETALATGDLATAARLSHALKGCGANLSARAVMEAASALETLCRDGQGENTFEYFQTLHDAVGSCIAGVGPLLSELTGQKASV